MNIDWSRQASYRADEWGFFDCKAREANEFSQLFNINYHNKKMDVLQWFAMMKSMPWLGMV